MKKITAVLLSTLLSLSMVCSVLADEVALTGIESGLAADAAATAETESELASGAATTTEIESELAGGAATTTETELELVVENEDDETEDRSEMETETETEAEFQKAESALEAVDVSDESEALEPQAEESISVSYGSITCGSEVTFTVSAQGGSGDYKYMLQYIELYDTDSGSYVQITDPSCREMRPMSSQTKQPYGGLDLTNAFGVTFYASGTYKLYFYVWDCTQQKYISCWNEEQQRSTNKCILTVEVNDAAYPSIDKIADQAAAQCLAAGCSTDYEKALWLHDWVLDHVRYDGSYTYCGAEGVLVRGLATCEGYRKAYAMLLKRVGLSYKLMEGNGHGWIAVKMDGKWYQIDPTWDDTGYNETFAGEKHLYFGLTDELMALAHDQHSTVSGYACTSYENNYFIKSGQIKTWSDPLASQIQNKMDAGVTHFSVDIDTSTFYAANIIYRLAAWELSQRSWAKKSGQQMHVSAVYTDATSQSKAAMTFTISEIDPSGTQDPEKDESKYAGCEGFVERLYKVCLDRDPDNGGFSKWVNKLYTGDATGSSAAYGFLFSLEFKNKNYCNRCFVIRLYKAIMGRGPDSTGLEKWIKKLENGATREEIFNGFIASQEFRKLCESYGIVVGSNIDVPKLGTIPVGSCKGCGAEDLVSGFVTRLYEICLNRKPDSDGLRNWCAKLRCHTITGTECAYGFIFSKEFQGKNYGDADYVEYLYKAIMGRGSDPAGKANWVKKLAAGKTRQEVFYGFTGSQEFAKLCAKYGISK